MNSRLFLLGVVLFEREAAGVVRPANDELFSPSETSKQVTNGGSASPASDLTNGHREASHLPRVERAIGCNATVAQRGKIVRHVGLSQDILFPTLGPSGFIDHTEMLEYGPAFPCYGYLRLHVRGGPALDSPATHFLAAATPGEQVFQETNHV